MVFKVIDFVLCILQSRQKHKESQSFAHFRCLEVTTCTASLILKISTFCFMYFTVSIKTQRKSEFCSFPVSRGYYVYRLFDTENFYILFCVFYSLDKNTKKSEFCLFPVSRGYYVYRLFETENFYIFFTKHSVSISG